MKKITPPKIGRVSARLEGLEGWNEEVKRSMEESIGRVVYGQSIAIWLPSVRQIGGVYNISYGKKPIAEPVDKQMPPVDLSEIESVKKAERSTIAKLANVAIGAGTVSMALFGTPVLALVGYVAGRSLLRPLVVYEMVVTNKFLVGAHPSKDRIRGFLMVSQATFKRHRNFWTRWEVEHRV
jgi:hypothetical protein